MLRISQRLCGRNSESIPQSKTGHCEIQIRALRVGTEQNKWGAGSGPRLQTRRLNPAGFSFPFAERGNLLTRPFKPMLSGCGQDSLSKVAFAITGTKWNGPRFFGLRDKEDRLDAGARS